jgi:hypothetical protein
MNVKIANSINHSSESAKIRSQAKSELPDNQSENSPTLSAETEVAGMDPETLTSQLLTELLAKLKTGSRSAPEVANRMAEEVNRICQKSDRIQNSGKVQSWQLTLGRHRLQKCVEYFRLGSRQGRVELHAQLSSMVYRHISSNQYLTFQARYNLIEDFLQNFYIEVLRAFRREHDVPENYTPRTQLQLAEYMAFTEQYAKRRINLPGCRNQQLIILRAQGFAYGQPQETVMDIEQTVEFPKGEEAEKHSRSYAAQQVREQMVSDTVDPADAVLRDRVVKELIEYLEGQGQSDCVNYLVLKLQDMSAPDIDEMLGLTPRQRDYLQQRFKYHVEKFSRSGKWKLVHQWLGADLDQNLGMPLQEWDAFILELSPEQRLLLQLKREHASDQEIAAAIKCTPKQVQKRWSAILQMAWQLRNAQKNS